MKLEMTVDGTTLTFRSVTKLCEWLDATQEETKAIRSWFRRNWKWEPVDARWPAISVTRLYEEPRE